MTAKLVLLGLLLICAAADAAKGYPREPPCGDYGPACPLILLPVCGTDGQTYPNECVMCIQRANAAILIEKDESC